MSRLACSCLFLASAALPALAQRAPVEAGNRVRITMPAHTPAHFEGVVAYVRPDTLYLVPRTGLAAAVALADVSALEVRRRNMRRHGARRGAMWGLGVGAVLAGISLATPRPAEETWSETTLAFEAVAYSTLVGALVGAAVPRHTWTPTSVADVRAFATRDAARAAAAAEAAAAPETPVADSSPSISESPRSPVVGATPLVELAFGLDFNQLPGAQFPGLVGSAAMPLTRLPRFGVAAVGEVSAAHLRLTAMAGARVYGRTAPLYGSRRVITYFGQLLAGPVKGGDSGVMHSDDGTGIQAGVGLDYGRGPVGFRVQLDHRSVPNAKVYDERVIGPIASMTGSRFLLAWTYRLGPRG